MSNSTTAQQAGINKITPTQFSQIEGKKYHALKSHVFLFEDLGIKSVMVESFVIPLIRINDNELPKDDDVAYISLHVFLDKLKDTLPLFFVFNGYTKNFFVFNDVLQATDLIKHLQKACKDFIKLNPPLE